ncbi:nitroreductase [Virgibacillus natechei]|uniref:Nitroreductase n=1 Tax=Virgibacillus natechei TaxID=1216297 RepID=A0ABS4IGJ9_9BACI|nr:hypothetical protein [Virgibacillus natechei]MBP1970075.1 nitroreductase [Virgibacillus natechei]UZD14156.1 hypothetical protein OLD84_06460 [Virgibacillus natechei]
MDVFQAIQKRREITKYEDQPISDVLRKVEDAGIFSSTGNNLQPEILK